jgi:hypothetical protein
MSPLMDAMSRRFDALVHNFDDQKGAHLVLNDLRRFLAEHEVTQQSRICDYTPEQLSEIQASLPVPGRRIAAFIAEKVQLCEAGQRRAEAANCILELGTPKPVASVP